MKCPNDFAVFSFAVIVKEVFLRDKDHIDQYLITTNNNEAPILCMVHIAGLLQDCSISSTKPLIWRAGAKLAICDLGPV